MKNILAGKFLILVMAILLTGCSKDYSSLLTEGIWEFKDMTTTSEVSSVISMVSLAEALLTGATLEFQEGGTYILNSPLVENPTTGEWELIGDERLVLDPDGEASSTSAIRSLTKDKLSYSENFVDAEMNAYRVITTWIR